jgi:histidine decarboxylase
MHTYDLEREVLGIFAELTHAPADAHWGYVTNGGTEGNMYGLFLARELHPGGIVYHSEDTHYSVNKILRALNVRSISVRSRPDGTMNLADLAEKIDSGSPPIILANIGTTMTGAVDDLAGIHDVLKRHRSHDHYIHADAALGGMMLPFLESPPLWDFSAPVDSIAISGHKMIGSPFPCGVVLARKANVDRIANRVEYLNTRDTTIAGSRNGHAPMFLWYAMKTMSRDGFRVRIRRCMEVADYACGKLNAIGRHAWRHPYSNTVVFDRPAGAVVRKWQLAVTGDIAHIVTMPQVTREQIDRFVADVIGTT